VELSQKTKHDKGQKPTAFIAVVDFLQY